MPQEVGDELTFSSAERIEEVLPAAFLWEYLRSDTPLLPLIGIVRTGEIVRTIPLRPCFLPDTGVGVEANRQVREMIFITASDLFSH